MGTTYNGDPDTVEGAPWPSSHMGIEPGQAGLISRV